MVKFTSGDQPPLKPQFLLGCNSYKYLPVLTHCDIGQLVCTAVRKDGVQCRTIQVKTPQDKCSTDVSLISIETKQVVLHMIKNVLEHTISSWLILPTFTTASENIPLQYK